MKDERRRSFEEVGTAERQSATDPAEEVGSAATVTRHTDSHSAKGVTLAQLPETPTDAHLAAAVGGGAFVANLPRDIERVLQWWP